MYMYTCVCIYIYIYIYVCVYICRPFANKTLPGYVTPLKGKIYLGPLGLGHTLFPKISFGYPLQCGP